MQAIAHAHVSQRASCMYIILKVEQILSLWWWLGAWITRLAAACLHLQRARGANCALRKIKLYDTFVAINWFALRLWSWLRLRAADWDAEGRQREKKASLHRFCVSWSEIARAFRNGSLFALPLECKTTLPPLCHRDKRAGMGCLSNRGTVSPRSKSRRWLFKGLLFSH